MIITITMGTNTLKMSQINYYQNYFTFFLLVLLLQTYTSPSMNINDICLYIAILFYFFKYFKVFHEKYFNIILSRDGKNIKIIIHIIILYVDLYVVLNIYHLTIHGNNKRKRLL